MSTVFGPLLVCFIFFGYERMCAEIHAVDTIRLRLQRAGSLAPFELRRVLRVVKVLLAASLERGRHKPEGFVWTQRRRQRRWSVTWMMMMTLFGLGVHTCETEAGLLQHADEISRHVELLDLLDRDWLVQRLSHRLCTHLVRGQTRAMTAVMTVMTDPFQRIGVVKDFVGSGCRQFQTAQGPQRFSPKRRDHESPVHRRGVCSVRPGDETAQTAKLEPRPTRPQGKTRAPGSRR